MIKAAKAEALIRRVLAHTPPGLFQHMMRTINSQVGAGWGGAGAGRAGLEAAAGGAGLPCKGCAWAALIPSFSYHD